jgi:hypothetical protein
MNDRAMFARRIFEPSLSLVGRLRLWSYFTLQSDRVFKTLLSTAELFDNRPGRLYSFVGHKAQR